MIKYIFWVLVLLALAGVGYLLLNSILKEDTRTVYYPIRWDKNLLPSPNVRISLIERISTNPDTYEVKKILATSTKNTGSLTDEYLGSQTLIMLSLNQFIEISCAEVVEQECKAIIL